MSKAKLDAAKTSGPSPQLTPQRGFRIPEAAIYMGVSPWTVEVLIRSKQLNALKLSRHYTILRDDMDAFLDKAIVRREKPE
jgi:excisionase family DNA binding protein